ncbi:MAG: DegQ family serine endoprotease [Candidatus Tectomicrobia bacterium]|nr:DegQ family serine endoprotease [Candidatus Tectomicrobia bacterium]
MDHHSSPAEARFGKKSLLLTAVVALLLGVGLATLAGVSHHGAEVYAQAASAPGTVAAAPNFSELAARLSPSVVNVDTVLTVRPEWPGGKSPFAPPFGEEFFERFFGMRPPQQQRRGKGSGVIFSQDGYILTNNHVVEGADQVTVTLADGTKYPARVVGRDDKTDLGLLKIDKEVKLTAARLGDSDTLKVGEWVMAIGNPFGLGHTVTVGIVSAKGRIIGSGPYDDFIQTDASINPGNSGGPLFNTAGEVIGINTAIIAQGQGIGFAIPVNMAKDLLPGLRQGRVVRGWLGVSIQTVTPELAEALQLKARKGALVAEVLSGSPAAQAGVRRGDVIVRFAGEEVDDSHTLPRLVARVAAGKSVSLEVIRDGKRLQLSTTIRVLSEEPAAGGQAPQEPSSQLGLRLQELTPELAARFGVESRAGLIVVELEPGSAAERAGVQRGDVLLEANHKPLRSVRDLREALRNVPKGRALLVVLERNGRSLFTAIPVG